MTQAPRQSVRVVRVAVSSVGVSVSGAVSAHDWSMRRVVGGADATHDSAHALSPSLSLPFPETPAVSLPPTGSARGSRYKPGTVRSSLSFGHEPAV